ncbi:MAG: hypothetical protein OXH65_10800 [Paracoccaceae bacterium]|nr:hypothetical protein [Paracoccaceae bacterium]
MALEPLDGCHSGPQSNGSQMKTRTPVPPWTEAWKPSSGPDLPLPVKWRSNGMPLLQSPWEMALEPLDGCHSGPQSNGSQMKTRTPIPPWTGAWK